MDYVLSSYLPPELVDIIAHKVWDMNIKEVHRELVHNVVWIYHRVDRGEYKYTFMISKNTNYFSVLDFMNIAHNELSGDLIESGFISLDMYASRIIEFPFLDEED